jgi:hypothetical protein
MFPAVNPMATPRIPALKRAFPIYLPPSNAASHIQNAADLSNSGPFKRSSRYTDPENGREGLHVLAVSLGLSILLFLTDHECTEAVSPICAFVRGCKNSTAFQIWRIQIFGMFFYWPQADMVRRFGRLPVNGLVAVVRYSTRYH